MIMQHYSHILLETLTHLYVFHKFRFVFVQKEELTSHVGPHTLIPPLFVNLPASFKSVNKDCLYKTVEYKWVNVNYTLKESGRVDLNQ